MTNVRTIFKEDLYGDFCKQSKLNEEFFWEFSGNSLNIFIELWLNDENREKNWAAFAKIDMTTIDKLNHNFIHIFPQEKLEMKVISGNKKHLNIIFQFICAIGTIEQINFFRKIQQKNLFNNTKIGLLLY